MTAPTGTTAAAADDDDDIFTSDDSPHQSQTSINNNNDGLHHRSSRRLNNKIMSTAAGNNNISPPPPMTMIRSSRVVLSHHRHHHQTTRRLLCNYKRILSCLIVVLLMIYIGTLLYTHILLGKDNNGSDNYNSDNNDNWKFKNEAIRSSRNNNNNNNNNNRESITNNYHNGGNIGRVGGGGGVRSKQREESRRRNQDYDASVVNHGAMQEVKEVVVVVATTTAEKSSSSSNLAFQDDDDEYDDIAKKEQKDYQMVVSLQDFGRRRRRRRWKRGVTSDYNNSNNNENNISRNKWELPKLPFMFNPSRQQQQQQQQQDFYSTEKQDKSSTNKSFLDTNNSSSSSSSSTKEQYLDNVKRLQEERRQLRKRRTTPPLPSMQQQQQQQVDDAPPTLWYQLDHSSYNTVLTNQKRWEDDTIRYNYNSSNSNNDASSSSSSSSSPSLDTNFHLCGHHARQASLIHPRNYYPPLSTSTSQQQSYHTPLDSSARVLITGILTPLGFHLTLALHRQCNITNFVGVDSQIPNDPLSRLEMMDRLEVLLEELSPSSSTTTAWSENTDGGKKESSSSSSSSIGKSLWYVPFLGLEPKQQHHHHVSSNKNEPLLKVEERERRQRQLVKIRNHPHHYIIDTNNNNNNNKKAGILSSSFHTQPYLKYGIPFSPGVDENGYGTLDIIAEYHPTHIVHLAGTQSDSLLMNSKLKRRGNDDDHQKRMNEEVEEEGGENDIGESGGSSRSVTLRPHLYELRMGMVGMEQLLSSVVAQTMISSSLSSSLLAEDGTKIHSSPSPPHVVYASSYDSLYFSETSKRLNNNSQRQHHYHHNDNDNDNNNHHHIRRNNNNNNKEIMLGEGEQITTKRRKYLSPPRGFHGVSHLINEILATTYQGLHGISSIGLRFDAIYGPRGFGAPSTSVPILNIHRMRKNVGVSPDVALAEVEVRRMYRKWMKMIQDNNNKKSSTKKDDGGEEVKDEELSLIEESGWLHASHHQRDFVFVEDAVGAIMAAMQYRSVQGSPTTFNIGSGEMHTLAAFADKIQQVAFDDKRAMSRSKKSVIDVELSNAASSASYTSSEYLGWSAKTTLKDGVAKLLAWHLDRALPFFPSSTLSEDDEVDYSGDVKDVKHMDGKELLLRNNVKSSCSDATCLAEKHTSYPCASECSTMTCTSSIFDSVLPLVHDTTDDCYLVLYTAPLGYDVESLNVETEYSDSASTYEYHEGTVCTIAFVPSESTLAKDVINDLPANTLATLNASPSDSYSEKLKKLNGHLSHRGWLLIFVDGATKPLSPEELLLPKLAPARLFHSSVRRAIYVDENFDHSPYPEDALFLATESYRGVTKSRIIKGPDEKGRETKYRLSEEPQRYAVVLASQMRDISSDEGHKISLRDVTRAMMNERGFDTDAHEPTEVKAQREFYERGRSLINSMDLRSSGHHHKIEFKDFIRSQWVLYNLKLEEGHHVRCEWYREHSHWAGSNTLDSGMDQLSFAYVMAKLDLSRKIVTEEPLPKELSFSEKVIKAATDAHEWHPVFWGSGSQIPLHGSFITQSARAIPLNIEDQFDLEKVVPEYVTSDTESSYYVRIVSDQVMLKARKEWQKFVARFEKD